MKPPRFVYHAPETVEEALDLLAEGDDAVKVLSGGQSLIPMLNYRLARPAALVDIGGVDELDYVRDDSGGLRIGAGASQAAVARSDSIVGWPMIAAGISHIGHPQIRNRGTVCGSLVHHDPAAELPALAVALDATVTLTSARRPSRRVPAADFFVSPFETLIESDELLTELHVPPVAESTGWSVLEVSRRRGDFASVGVIATVASADGIVDNARLVLFGVGGRPVRTFAAEAVLIGNSLHDAVLDKVSACVVDAVDPPADVHASAEYRRELAGVLAVRAIRSAWERCS